jgi:hypothetical protein
MRVTVGAGAADEDEDEDSDVEVGLPVVVTSGFPLGWLGSPSLPGGSEGGVTPGGRGTPPKGTALIVNYRSKLLFHSSLPQITPPAPMIRGMTMVAPLESVVVVEVVVIVVRFVYSGTVEGINCIMKSEDEFK